VFRGALRGIRGCLGFTVYFVSETAHVELKSGRVEAPACSTAPMDPAPFTSPLAVQEGH
jgi:hypothetical protein